MKKKTKTTGWESTRDDLRNLRYSQWVQGYSNFPGTYILEVAHKSYPFPMATVWYRFQDNATAIEILNSFVFDKVRRCGLRTYLNKTFFEIHPGVMRIRTDTGTPDGIAWMQAVGYKKTKIGWEIERPKK